MVSMAVSTTFSTATATANPPSTTLLIVDTFPCSDIRLSSCGTPESCVVQVLPSALCWDDAHTTWSISSAPSCAVTSTPLAVPVVTSSQDFCPMGMTIAHSTISSVGGWCCPIGFTWDSTPQCRSSIAPGKAPQISSACSGGNTFALGLDTAQLLKRMTGTPLWRRDSAFTTTVSSPVLSTPGTSLSVPPESATTAIFAEAIYLAGQTIVTENLAITTAVPSDPSPSVSGNIANGKGSNSQDVLSGTAKVAIGLGSALAGTFLLLLGIFFIRRHRQRTLREKRKNENKMFSKSYCKGYITRKPESREGRNTNRGQTRPIRPRRDPEPVSPAESCYDDSIRLYTPETERPLNRERMRNMLGLDTNSISGTTFVSLNQFEPAELEASPASPRTTLSRKNTRASSQVLPWLSGAFDYWSGDPEEHDGTEHDQGI